ncbi:MAG: hypothetical protein RLZZ595_1533, partial [Bacteroidota bacterium]
MKHQGELFLQLDKGCIRYRKKEYHQLAYQRSPQDRNQRT